MIRVAVGLLVGLVCFAVIGAHWFGLLLASMGSSGPFYSTGIEGNVVGLILLLSLAIIPITATYLIIRGPLKLAAAPLLLLVVLVGASTGYYGSIGIQPVFGRNAKKVVVHRPPASTPRPWERVMVVVELGQGMRLRVGQVNRVGPEGPYVEFMQVLEDSRCPIGAQCIEQGRAMVFVRVWHPIEGGWRIADRVLEAGNDPEPYASREGDVEYLLVLDSLEPHPESDNAATPHYVAILTMTTQPVQSQ